MGGKGSGGNSRPSGYKNDKSKKRAKAIGTRWETNNYGWIEVIDYIDSSSVSVRFDNTGFIKHCVKMQAIKGGRVADDSLGKVQLITTKYPIGMTFKMKNGATATVIEPISWCDIRVEIEGVDGVISLSSENIKVGAVSKSKIMKHWNYLDVDTTKYYVYMCKYKGYLLYIGMGKGRRYLHPTSGRSHSIELNGMFFLGMEVEVSIFKEGLSNEEASDLEKYLIKTLKPPYNKTGIDWWDL